MSLSRRLFSGASWSLLDQALKMGSALVLTPLIVRALGAGPYGAWCVLIAVFAQYGWLDLGLTVSMPRFFARAVGRHDPEEIQSLAGTARVIFLAVAVLSLGATALVAWGAPGWFEQSQSGEGIRTVVAVFGVFLAVQTLCQPHLGYLKGHLRYDRIAIASICRVLASSILIYGVLVRGQGLVALAIIHAGCGLMECLLLVLFARCLDPSLKPQMGAFQKSRAVELMRYSAVAYLMMAGQNLRNTFDPVLIAAQAGEAAVTGYALGTRFPVLFVDLAHILAGGQLLSLFSRYVGNNDQAGLGRAYAMACQLCCAVAALGAAMMWLFGSAFLQRWIPEHALAAWQVMAPAVLPKALFVAQTPSMVLLLAMARHRRLAEIDWVAGSCNLALTWWLVGWLGAPGAAWATCWEQSLVCGLVWPWLGARAAGLTFLRVWWGMMAKPLLRAALVLLPCLLLRSWVLPNYGHLVLIGGITAVWFVTVSLWTLRTEDRQWVLRQLPFGGRQATNEDASFNDPS
jgi:O-antigen/teichoic acid export membrane protein